MPTPPLKLISSMATRSLLTDLIAHCQIGADQPASSEAVGGLDVAKRVRAGEAFDIVVLASNVIDQLIAEGHLVAGSRVDLVQSGVAIAVAAGAAQPDISTEAAVRQAVLNAPSLSYSTGPSGVALVRLFERWGIADAVAARTVQAPPGVPVGSLVAQGRVALGFQQLSELMNLPGITVLGPLPPEIQTLTTFSAGLATSSAHAPAVRALLAHWAAPGAAQIKRDNGMEPV